MRIFTLVLILTVQLLSSQLYVNENTTLYVEGENRIVSDSISFKNDAKKTPRNIIYISSGSQILISGDQNFYSIVKIDGELTKSKEKDKRLAKITPQKKQKALDKVREVKIYPEVKKTKFYWPLESSNTTFSVSSKRSHVAVLREHFKVENINFAKSFHLKFTHFFSYQKNITSCEISEIEKWWYFSLSVRPPPFV